MAESLAGTSHAFHLEVITPERAPVDQDARSLVAPAEDGMVGVLPNHAPLVSALKAGVLTYTTTSGEKRLLSVGDGFLEVASNQVRVIVSSAETPDQIDVARAKAARQRAEERLARRGSADVDFARAESALRRAMARLRAANAL